jgi:hypothetical protein
MRSRTRPAAPPAHSVKELLGRGPLALKRVTDHLIRAHDWHSWLTARLPGALALHISGISAQAGTLVVFATSAAWCARLRYAVLELEAEIRGAAPELKAIEVRVLPRA